MKEDHRGRLFLVTGGSGSGKSEYAERLAVEQGGQRRLYLATMRVWDEEGRIRVERHRRQRAGKGFVTAERYTNLADFPDSDVPESEEREAERPVFDTILLECMSNLAANEFYEKEEGADRRILTGVNHLRRICRNLIIVTNEIFSDGLQYDPETRRYLKLLGTVNCCLGRQADEVTEVVYGIPVRIKSSGKEKEG